MKSFPLHKANRFIEPGPIVLVTTANRGRANVMTMGFHMMLQHSPPLIGAVIGPWDFSHRALRETGEAVIAVPTVDLAQKVVDIGNVSGEDVDKFERFGLTPLPAETVAAPLIAEALANLECRVVDDSLVDRYGLFILEAVRIWHNPDRAEQRALHHRGDGSFTADGDFLDLSNRMVKWRQLLD